MRTNEGARPRWSFLVQGTKSEKFLAANFLTSFVLAGLILFFLGPGAVVVRRDFEGIAPGVMANRDIIASQNVVYIDKDATRLRIEAEERLVLPVFQIDTAVTSRAKSQFQDFASAFRGLAEQNIAQGTAILMLESRFPGLLSRDLLSSLATSSLKSQILAYADDILSTLLEGGIFSVPAEGLSRFNPDYFELRQSTTNTSESEQKPRTSMVTKVDLREAIGEELGKRHLARPLSTIVQGLAMAFAVENAFFDESASLARLKRVASKVEPVSRSIGRNELLVRKGEIITDEAFVRIQTIRGAMSKSDIGLFLRGIGILLAAAGLGYLLLRRDRGKGGREGEGAFLFGIYASLAFYLVVILAARVSGEGEGLAGAYLLPTALFTGIAAALVSQSFAVSYSVVLSLLAASAANLNPFYLIFVLLSGIFASFSITTAKTRIDLVRAGLVQAALQFLIGIVLLAHFDLRFGEFLGSAGYLALNGFVCGVLVLATLPILEQSFNLPTRFRLLELSDVNAPALKELLTQAPGTYAHSMNVAHLAEAAAEDIGANALLARVGAYYHDLGKLGQPDYFIENQKGVNKHDDMNPRLSATVIRSHVKLGIEKAKELHLPKAIVDIVGQHHGNSLIVWFYDKAKNADDGINREDFVYPGTPPIDKEAGIVMLADVVEASTRTLKNPSVPRLDAYVRQLILDKVKDGQLDRCALTLNDLEAVRHAFVRILAGQYHSRIEYPKQKESGQ
ncbi:MAG: HDIG domain-containing protein [Spirochaetes bacterium]|nr:HDIG domain-containing protein [Spirochaetota bacterium]